MAFTHYILVCGGTGCESSNADLIYKNLLEEAKNFGVEDKVQIVKTGCFGFCEKGPIVKVLPEDSFYVEVKPEYAKEIIAEQVVKGREVKRLLYNKEKKSIEDVEEIQFYQKEFARIVDEYALKEDGQMVYSEDMTSIKIIPGKEDECSAKIVELKELEVDFSGFEFTLDEFDSLELTLAEMSSILPLIKD